MADLREVEFIDPNDDKLTYGLLNADNTAGAIFTSKWHRGKELSSDEGPQLDYYGDIKEDAYESGDLRYLHAFEAMVASNPVE